MKLYFLLFLPAFFLQKTFGQRDTISINGVKFITKTQAVKNDYRTKDTLLTLYKLDSGKTKYLLKYYLYQYGADAENEFTEIGTIRIQSDSIILLTHYLQKGFDPIPVWRKKIYKVTPIGKVALIFNKCKERNSNKWTKCDFPDN